VPKVLYLDDTVPEGEKRKVNYTIEKNKGLTRKQPKINRNPRVKLRYKYLKALKRRTGQVAPLRDRSKPYEGERAGIKSKVVRSIPLDD
jgi:U3 small nucleolar RNA-associated protein 3